MPHLASALNWSGGRRDYSCPTKPWLLRLFTSESHLESNQFSYPISIQFHARKLGLTTQVQPSIGDDPIMFPISQLHHPHNHYHIPQNPRNSTNIATTIWLLTNKLILTLHHPATNQDHQKNIESKFTSQGPHSKQREKRNALNREPSNLAKTRIQMDLWGLYLVGDIFITFSTSNWISTYTREQINSSKKEKEKNPCVFFLQPMRTIQGRGIVRRSGGW